MPSVSPKQAKFMRAVSHGWVPPSGKAPPVSVAREFEKADEAKKKGNRTRAQRADRKRETNAWALGQRDVLAKPE